MNGGFGTTADGPHDAILRYGGHDAAIAVATITRIDDERLNQALSSRSDIDADDVIHIAATSVVARNVFNLIDAAGLDCGSALNVLAKLDPQRWLADLERHLGDDGYISGPTLDACVASGNRQAHHIIVASENPAISGEVIEQGVAAICACGGIVRGRMAVQRILDHGYGPTFKHAFFSAVAGYAGRFGDGVTVDGGARRWLSERVDAGDVIATELRAVLTHLCYADTWEVADWLHDRLLSGAVFERNVAEQLEAAAELVGVSTGNGDLTRAAIETRGLAESQDPQQHRELIDLLSRTADSSDTHITGAFGSAAYRLTTNAQVGAEDLAELAVMVGMGSCAYRSPILAGLRERGRLSSAVIVATEPWLQPTMFAHLLKAAEYPLETVAAVCAAAPRRAATLVEPVLDDGNLSADELAGVLPVAALTSPEMAGTTRRTEIRDRALGRIVDAVGNEALRVRFLDELDTTGLTVDDVCNLLTCL